MAEAKKAPRGWELSSTCCYTQSTGETLGRTIALAETGAQTLAQLLAAQARAKFGADNPTGKALLEALAAARASDRLKVLGETLLAAPDWSTWLAGIEAPPPAPNDFPEYVLDDDMDLEPEQAFIEMTAQVATFAGKKMIFQVRLQKWYQPNLGQLVYEESCRIEKKFKATPIMAIILMWPSADGPEVTGQYCGKDEKGRPVNFRYEIKRAWEMDPESSMSSPGTMMLVPLAKGAKQRMPELIRLMKDKLAKLNPEPRSIEAVWATVYWSMGMVCTLEESHAALGDLLPMIHATTDYKRAHGGAFRKGYTETLKEGPILAARELIRLQASKRFGDDPASVAKVEAIHSYDALKAIAIRAPTAASWSELLGNAT